MSPDNRLAGAAQVTLALLDELLGSREGGGDFAVRLWDGTIWPASASGSPAVTLVLTHPGSLRRALMRPSELSLAECYIAGDLDIEGDVELLLDLGEWLLRQPRSLRHKLRLGRQLLRLPSGRPQLASPGRPQFQGAEHSQARDRAAVTHHYKRLLSTLARSAHAVLLCHVRL